MIRRENLCSSPVLEQPLLMELHADVCASEEPGKRGSIGRCQICPPVK